jgi:hypothetical protein
MKETVFRGAEREVWAETLSAVSWTSVLAGAFVAATLSLVLLALS